MEIQPVVEFRQIFKMLPDDKIIFSACEKSPLTPLCQRGVVAFLIGPEGGFSKSEIEIAKKNGCQIRSLGPLTLRAETAAIAALTLIQHELGNL